MTTPYLLDDIRREEGLSLEAYPDPVSHGDPWTIGYGCTGPLIRQGTVWTPQQAEIELQNRVARVTAALDKAIPWWRTLSDPRQDVLVQMGYQMGVEGLLAFHRMLTDLQDGNVMMAAAEMDNSRWTRQTNGREKRMAKQLLDDVRIAA